MWEKFKIGIWILTAANEEEYDKLFKEPNWRDYWKSSWNLEPTPEEIFDELDYELEEEENILDSYVED